MTPELSMANGVSLHAAGTIATLTVDRPGRRNALGLSTWRALKNLAGAAERDPAVRVVIVRGSGRSFGAGNDISELEALRGDAEGGEAFGFAMATAMEALENLSKPVVMAIEGPCYGAAVALTLTGDLRVASQDAVFAITPAKLGALYLGSDLHRLVAAIGKGQTKRLIYTAEAIDAAEAQQIGLVDLVLPADRFEIELLRIVDAMLAGSPYTLRRTKQMLQDLGQGRPPRETGASLAPFVEAMQGPEFQEGVCAFRDKRPPRFVAEAPALGQTS